MNGSVMGCSMDRIERIIQHTEGPTVLDLGAVQHDIDNTDRDEWLHDHLVDEFDRVIGVDILPREIAELSKQGYEMYQADVTEMDIDVTADTIVAGELIEHIANPGQMLARCAEHLKPGGKIVLSTPNPWGGPLLRRLLRGSLSINEEHVAWYTPTVIDQLLNRYGFAMSHAATTRRPNQGMVATVARYANVDVLSGTTWVFVGVKQ